MDMQTPFQGGACMWTHLSRFLEEAPCKFLNE